MDVKCNIETVERIRFEGCEVVGFCIEIDLSIHLVKS